jgi:predicted kinase
MSTKEKELEVVIYIGMPASGKTSASKDFIRKNPNYVKVSRDDFRHMLKNQGVCEPKIESMINDLMDQAIIKSLSKKLNVIVDGTNLKEHKIRDIIKLVNPYANVSYRTFDLPYKTVIERNSKRENPVDEIAMNNMWEDWEILKDSFDFQPVKRKKIVKSITPNFNSKLPDCVIFDLDGTLALSNGKRDMFDYNNVDGDDLNEIIAEQVVFHKSKGRKIIIVSGRDEICRNMTEYWLNFYNVEYDLMFMRPKDNIQRDKVVKKKIFEDEIQNKYNVIAWYDDRLQIIELIYELGIFTFNVNQGMMSY